MTKSFEQIGILAKMICVYVPTVQVNKKMLNTKVKMLKLQPGLLTD
jgi:hypothetical protein